MLQDSPIKVFLVEDFDIIRTGLKLTIEENPEITVVGEARSAEEALESIRYKSPDVVLLDLDLPKMGGIEAIKEIKKINEDIKFIILTSHDEEEKIVSALHAGVSAYCIKNTDANNMAFIIQTVAAGGFWLAPKIAQFVISSLGRQLPLSYPEYFKPSSDFSERELQVLHHIAEGKNNSEIAELMFLSVHTIKVHVRSILQKFSVDDRVQAAVQAVKNGVINV